MARIIGIHQIEQIEYSALISSGGTSLSGTVDAPAGSTMTFVAKNTGLYKIYANPWLYSSSGNVTAQFIGTVGSPILVEDSQALQQTGTGFSTNPIYQHVTLTAGVSYTFIIRTTGSGFFGMNGYMVAEQIL